MIIVYVLIAAVTGAFAIYQYFVWQANYWNRRGIPGPAPRLFYGNSKDLINFDEPQPLKLREWTKKYGKVFGVKEGVRNALVISDIELINEVFVKQFDAFFARRQPPLSEDLDNNPRVNLFESRGSRWKRLRALASPSFSINSLKKIQPIIDDSAVKMVEIMGKKHGGGESFDVSRFFAEYTLDTICRLIFGQKESTLFENPRLDVFRGVFLARFDTPIIFLAGAIPRIARAIRNIAIKMKTPVRQKVNEIFAEIEVAVNKRIEDRNQFGPPVKPADFIDLFLENAAEFDYQNRGEFSTLDRVTKSITVDEVISQALSVIYRKMHQASTQHPMHSPAWMLSRHPEVMKRCQAEIDEECRDSSISYEDTQKLRYLDAVCRETLRFYPLAAKALSRTCMKATTVGGYDIEKGTTVICDTHTVHFSKELWGDDAEEFRPERWLDSEKRAAAINFLSFGAGPRLCIGMRLAMMEEKIALAHLLRRFDIFPDEKVSELTLVGCTTISPVSVPIKIQPRV